MSARYQFFRTPASLLAPENGDKLHVRIVDSRIIHIQELCDNIRAKSSFSSGDVKGVVDLLKEEIILALSEGDKVDLEGIGGFEATLTCPPVQNPKEIRAESIRFSRVVFRPAETLNRRLKSMTVERAPLYPKPESLEPEEKRYARIFSYLKKEPFIRSAECMGLNHCSRYRAQQDLKTLYNAGKLECPTGPRAGFYSLPENTKK